MLHMQHAQMLACSPASTRPRAFAPNVPPRRRLGRPPTPSPRSPAAPRRSACAARARLRCPRSPLPISRGRPPPAARTRGARSSRSWIRCCTRSPAGTASATPTSTTSCRSPGGGRSSTSTGSTTRAPSPAGSPSPPAARRCARCSAECGRCPPPSRPSRSTSEPGPDALALDGERGAALRAAIGRLTGRQRELLSLLVRRPELSYDEVSSELAMPVGSIGPTRERAFERLRSDTALASAVAA